MREHRTLEAWCLLAHLELGDCVCLGDGLKKTRPVCGSAEPSVCRDRVHLNIISGHFPWALACRRCIGYLEDQLRRQVGG